MRRYGAVKNKNVSKPKCLFIHELEKPAPADTVTTLAIGEEAGKWAKATTLAIGEEALKGK